MLYSNVPSAFFGRANPLPPVLYVSAIAIMPGRITKNGNNIFGTAAISGVRRAADIDLAAIARCTTRKSVHQYPNDRTNPRPIASPNHSTPIGFDEGEPMNFQDSLHAPDAKPFAVATVASRTCSPDQPPTSINPRNTSGANPKTIRKNCSTSL